MSDNLKTEAMKSGGQKEILSTVWNRNPNPKELSDNVQLELHSALAHHAHYELTQLLYHFCATDEDGEDGVNAYWAKSMLAALPLVMEVLSKNGLLSNAVAAPMTIDVIGRLVNHEPLTPLHSIEETPNEWADVSNLHDGKTVWQNRRYPAVFYHDDTKKYTNVNDRYFEKVPMNLTFTSNYFSDEAVKVFGPWLESLQNEPAPAYAYLYNLYAGSRADNLTMPYMPPERKYYQVDWVAEMAAMGMMNVLRCIDQPTEFSGDNVYPRTMLACEKIFYGIYPMEYGRHRNVFVWVDFSGHPATKATDRSHVYAVAELGEDFSNVAMDELKENIDYLETTMATYMQEIARTLSPVGKGESLFVSRASDNNEHWFITSNMIDTSVPAYKEILGKCQLCCDMVIGTGTIVVQRAPDCKATFDESELLFKWCPPLLDMAKKRVKQIDRLNEHGYNQVWFSNEDPQVVETEE